MLLTVFTPTYNRSHLLPRVYESLCCQSCQDFEWLVIDDGSTDGTRELVEGWINESKIPIRYHWKENGGLYTGYNKAYALAKGELCMCCDSDDWLPADAVEIIRNTWMSAPRRHGDTESGAQTIQTIESQTIQTIESQTIQTIESQTIQTIGGNGTQLIRNNFKQSDKNSVSTCLRGEYAGIVGLDFDARTGEPIGGWFPEDLKEVFFYEFTSKRLHPYDSKQAMRTDLMRSVAPMEGFPGEKNFNPVYLLWLATKDLPLIVVNANLCNVEYQVTDSMSAQIYKQYVNSPRSFAKQRLLELSLPHNTLSNRLRTSIHYIAECRLAKDRDWWRKHPTKWMAALTWPAGRLLEAYIRHKARY